MTDHKSLLCVGGPQSGKSYVVLHGSRIRVPIPVSTRPSVYEATDLVSDSTVRLECIGYRVERFHTPQGDACFLVPEGQTPLETISLLLEGYEQHPTQILSPGGGLP